MDRKNLNLELYKKAYLARKAEEAVCKYYPEDDMKTPVHLSCGEEAISAGVVQALGPLDQIFGTYRSHGIYLAKTGETDDFFAELYGKTTGLAKGKAGSMHLSAPEAGFMGTAAIVGGIIPVAVGAAYANKRLNKKRMTAVFFGDGATDEGVFWESLNAACLMKLPIIFVLEDNGLAVFTHKKFRQGYKSIIDIVKEFDCDTLSDDTTDAEKIYKLTKQAVSSVRRKNRPCFMHLKYYRYLEHVGVYEDFDAGYRSRREFEKWQKADPVALQRKKLLKLGFSEAKIKKAESAIDKQIEDSVRKAKEAAFPAEEELLRGIYA